MRLELTRRADYAMRGMLSLARHEPASMTGAAIAAETDMPGRFVTQVMGDLVRAGLVEARVGRAGGYRLAMATTAITILAVVEAVEGSAPPGSCVLRNGPCRRSSQCEVHELFAGARGALISRLGEASLAGVLSAADRA
jgi:Rrf2 family protein